MWVPLDRCPLALGPLAVLPRLARARALAACRRDCVAPRRGRRRRYGLGGIKPRARRRDFFGWLTVHRALPNVQWSRAAAVRNVSLSRSEPRIGRPGDERRRSPARRRLDDPRAAAGGGTPRGFCAERSGNRRRGLPVHPHRTARSRRGGGESPPARRPRVLGVRVERAPLARGRPSRASALARRLRALRGPVRAPAARPRGSLSARAPVRRRTRVWRGRAALPRGAPGAPRRTAARRHRRPRPPRDRAARGGDAHRARAAWPTSPRRPRPTSTAPSTAS